MSKTFYRGINGFLVEFSQITAENLIYPYRYVVTQTPFEDSKGMARTITYISLENEYGIPVSITPFHNFIANGLNPISPLKHNLKKYCLYFCGMLNYILFEHYETYEISSVYKITRDMMQEYFSYYAGMVLDDGFTRKSKTSWECVRACTFTMFQLTRVYGSRMSVTESDLLVSKMIRNRKGELVNTMVPTFTAHDGSNVEKDSIFREITTEAFELLIPLAYKYTPDIAFALCVQAFAGLRPSEVCYVRQPNSPLGPGIVYELDINGFSVPVIDLEKTPMLRSDGVVVGWIKNKRKQKVYPEFVEAFNAAYRFHMNYLKSCKFEKEYGPMFVTSRGMAMTYSYYTARFKVLVGHFITALLNSGTPDLQVYGKVLSTKKLGLHSMRHFFTVQLVLRNLTAAQLQEWRGDHDIESSMTYIMNKGELLKQAMKTGESLTKLLIDSARQRV